MSAAAPPRRRFRRRTVRVRVDYAIDSEQRSEWATTLGAGGMFIETEEPTRAGARFKACFALPGSEPHEIEARVVWVMAAGPPGIGPARAPGIGVEFTDPVAASRLAHELEDWEPTGV
ncbi:MAG: PilZ domain-containing protein [Deltaproteobacteria bacterium]|nr:PilZ domain-containing protein [Deltaproteobacteria bacterium]